MNINKAVKRDRKRNKRRYGHKIDNRSIFTIIEEQRKKAEQIKKERERRRNDHNTNK